MAVNTKELVSDASALYNCDCRCPDLDVISMEARLARVIRPISNLVRDVISFYGFSMLFLEHFFHFSRSLSIQEQIPRALLQQMIMTLRSSPCVQAAAVVRILCRSGRFKLYYP